MKNLNQFEKLKKVNTLFGSKMKRLYSFYIFLILQIIIVQSESCDGDSCNWYSRKFVKVSNAEGDDLISGDKLDVGKSHTKRISFTID